MPTTAKEVPTAVEEITVLHGLSPHFSVTSITKRLIDILGGISGIIITLVLAIPIAIAIQLDNPGPVFYSQIRCGYRGRPFRIWKFRSMVANADTLRHLVDNQAEGLIFKNQDDPRITRVGKFLRRTSLDEFPQFWNVLVGDMSLVGTRPPTQDEISQYAPPPLATAECEARHYRRMAGERAL